MKLAAAGVPKTSRAEVRRFFKSCRSRRRPHLLTERDIDDIRRSLRLIERTRKRLSKHSPPYSELGAQLQAVTDWGHKLLDRLSRTE
jgi:hypothetical protein